MSHDAARRVDATPSPLLDAEPVDVRIRPVATLAEFRACVGLQAEVWGPQYTDSVPASLLQVATYVGGVVLGAFTPEDELIGFLFGLTGQDGGASVHWSHLLGVRPAARNMGVGRLLKEAQRAALAERGVQRMSWTFDPLVARNAHLNLNRLGARIVSYVADMYGTTTSPLHYGIATDRLVVSVATTDGAAPAAAVDALAEQLPVLTTDARPGDIPVDRSAPPPALWIEIPGDIRQVIERDPAQAATWRHGVRDHFQWALARRYEVTALQRDPVASRCYYLLRRSEAA